MSSQITDIEHVYATGTAPELGVLPKQMYAWTLRNELLGEPIRAFQKELVDIPEPKENEVIVLNKAAGINYNGVWAALGKPKSVIDEHSKYEERQDFLICGSETSGIVYKIGANVKKVQVGDEIICVANQFDENCAFIKQGFEPPVSPTFRVWGYEGNWGGFAQYSKVHEQQCIQKPKNLSWESAASTISTGATAYGMLTHWEGNKIKAGDVVLIWGGSGGLGTSAIQIAKVKGAIPIAVVSSEERAQKCMELGAAGTIIRTDYDHFGALTEEMVEDGAKYKKWLKGCLKFRRAIWKIVGERRNPNIILEHPGSDTFPTSLFVCDKRGMVVTCGATSGYLASFDLRYLWLGLKRIQGSHTATIEEAKEYIKLVADGKIKVNVENTYKFDELPDAHQALYENNHPGGNSVLLIEE